MRRTAHFLTIAVALVLGLAGCSSETPGNATPGGDGGGPVIPTEGNGGDEPEPPTTSESDTGSPADSLQPCDLLTSEEQASLSLGPGEEEEIAGSRACTWQASGRHTIGTTIWDDLGLDEAEEQSKTEPQPKTIGSHKAMQYTGGVSTCSVAIELTESSRVDVSGVASDGDMTKACGVANQAAELVEPKLP